MCLCNNKLALWRWTYTPGLCTCLQSISVMRALTGCHFRLSWQLSRSSQSISSQPVCVCLGVQKFQGGAWRGTENPQGTVPWAAEYTRVYCTGSESGEAKFPVTPVPRPLVFGTMGRRHRKFKQAAFLLHIQPTVQFCELKGDCGKAQETRPGMFQKHEIGHWEHHKIRDIMLSVL